MGSSHYKQLDVIVVGAGVCGLASAVALGRIGHRVRVYERRARDYDSGAGITINENGARVLGSWGLQTRMRDEFGMIPYTLGEVRDGRTAEFIRIRRDVRHMRHEEDSWMTIRKDVCTMLEQEALRFPGVAIHYDVRVRDYEVDKPAVQVEHDGGCIRWEAADLIIACDGIHSTAVKYICGYETVAKPVGYSAFRQVTPTVEAIKVSDRLQAKMDEHGDALWVIVDFEGRIMAWWPTRGGELQVMDTIIPDNEKYAKSEEWTVKCDKADLIKEIDHWDQLYKDVVSAGSDPYLYKICIREPLRTMYLGKVCILGDALHPMPPFRGQGGTQGVEDAGALEVLLANISHVDEVPQRLSRLQELRLPRTSCVQLASEIRPDQNEQDAFKQVRERCWDSYRTDEQRSHLKDADTFNEWIWSYDVQKEAQQVMKEEN